MADLSTMYPSNPALGGFAGGLMQGQQYLDAQQNNQLNQQNALQDMFIKQQKLPGELAQQQATLEGTQASTRKTNTDTDKNIWNWKQEERLAEPKYQSELAKLMQGTQEAEVKTAHAQLEKDLLSTNPQVRARAKEMYKATGDMLKLYEKARLDKEQAESVARIGANSRQAVAARIPRTNQEALQYWRARAQDPEATPEERADALAMAEETRTLMMELAAARGTPWTMDAQGNMIPNPQGPGKSTPLTGAQPTQAQKPQHTIEQLRSMYPGKSDQEIRDAYKKKFGVSL